MNSENVFISKNMEQLTKVLAKFVIGASKDLSELKQLKCALPKSATPNAVNELFDKVSFLAACMETAMGKKRLYFRVHRDAQDALSFWSGKVEDEKIGLLSLHRESTKSLKTKDEKFAYINEYKDKELIKKVAMLNQIEKQTSTWYGQVCLECERVKRTKDMAALLFKIWQELFGDGNNTRKFSNSFAEPGGFTEQESPMTAGDSSRAVLEEGTVSFGQHR